MIRFTIIAVDVIFTSIQLTGRVVLRFQTCLKSKGAMFILAGFFVPTNMNWLQSSTNTLNSYEWKHVKLWTFQFLRKTVQLTTVQLVVNPFRAVTAKLQFSHDYAIGTTHSNDYCTMSASNGRTRTYGSQFHRVTHVYLRLCIFYVMKVFVHMNPVKIKEHPRKGEKKWTL